MAWRLFRLLLPAWVLLWLVVPPPFEYDRTVVLALQSLTTQQSSQLLDLFGVYHGVSGNLVEVNGQRLLVEQACGGVNSLLSILACTVFFVFFVHRPLVRGVLLVVSALFWVICANVARVFLVVMLFASRWHIDLTKGYEHEALGLALFAMALGLIWSTDQLLALVAAPVLTKPPGAASSVAEGPKSVRSDSGHWTWLAYWPCGAAFALLVAFYVTAHLLTATLTPFGHGPTLATLGSLNEEFLPKKVGACERKGFAVPPVRELGNEFGENSRAWVYRIGDSDGKVSLDYPFPNWHDLTRCYTSQGWEVVEENVLVPSGPKARDQVGYVQIRLKKPGFRTGYLLLCEFDGNGTVLEPRRSGSDLSWHRQASFFTRLVNFGKSAPGMAPIDPPGPIYQLHCSWKATGSKAPGDRGGRSGQTLPGSGEENPSSQPLLTPLPCHERPRPPSRRALHLSARRTV